MTVNITEPLSPEEEEVVDFLVDLIPVLEEIKVDLESKGLLDGFLTPPKQKNI